MLFLATARQTRSASPTLAQFRQDIHPPLKRLRYPLPMVDIMAQRRVCRKATTSLAIQMQQRPRQWGSKAPTSGPSTSTRPSKWPEQRSVTHVALALFLIPVYLLSFPFDLIHLFLCRLLLTCVLLMSILTCSLYRLLWSISLSLCSSIRFPAPLLILLLSPLVIHHSPGHFGNIFHLFARFSCLRTILHVLFLFYLASV